MKLIRTPEEIENKLDQIAYHEFCRAQSGTDGMLGLAQLDILNWLLDLNFDYSQLYPRGERLYKQGFRFDWDFKKGEYVRRTDLMD
jgi:hypothetical protein